MSQDRIALTVPAKGEYAKIVRMTAAGLVSRMDMTYDEVEDVRMAAEEAFAYAIDTLPADGEVHVDFLVGDGAIEISVALGDAQGAAGEEAERSAAYATFILESICDRYELASDESGAHLRLLKRCGVADAH